MFEHIPERLFEAWGRLAAGDPEVYLAAWVSVYCALIATAIAAAIGVPAGALLGLHQFRGKWAVATALNTLMAVPTVVIGLVCYGLFSRSGPLGPLDLLYTRGAIIAGELLLVLPIIVVLTQAALEQQDPRARLTLETLGASRARALAALVREARFGVMAGPVAAFGRAIGEVGIAMMLGGNIRAATRTLTTAIALETSRGEFSLALALGTILLAIALAANVVFRRLQARGRLP